MGQRVKDPMLSLKGLGSLLWLEFSPWPRNFHIPGVQPRGREKKRGTTWKVLKTSNAKAATLFGETSGHTTQTSAVSKAS